MDDWIPIGMFPYLPSTNLKMYLTTPCNELSGRNYFGSSREQDPKCLLQQSSIRVLQYVLVECACACRCLPAHLHAHIRAHQFSILLVYAFFLVAAAFVLDAFLRLLRIMTMLRNVPTTAEPSRMRMTGIRMAHTRGGKKFWSGWSASTKG